MAFNISTALFLLLVMIYSYETTLASEHANGTKVNAVDPSRSAHGIARVRELRVNETVHSTGSELLFTWELCDFCESYRLTLSKNQSSENRVLSYELRAGVTSFRVGQLRPRTTYRLEIKAVPDDTSAISRIEGVTFHNESPPPVYDLTVRPLTNASLYLEWKSNMSDGSVVKVLNEDTLVQEQQLPFAKESTLRISGLEAGTRYDIQVIAFFEPKTNKSSAVASTAQIRTLPSELPDVRFRWEHFDIEGIKLLWDNPKWPYPVGHYVYCERITTESRGYYGRHDQTVKVQVLDIYMGGSSDFLAVRSNIVKPDASLDCRLTTWFSSDPWSKKVYRLSIPRTQKGDSSERFCEENINSWKARFKSHASIDNEAVTENFKSHGLYVRFTVNQKDTRGYIDAKNQYQICQSGGICSGWKETTDSLYFGPRELSPWTSYVLKYRTKMTCLYNNHQTEYTDEKSLQLPEIWGAIPPVASLNVSQAGNSAVLSWEYKGPSKPDFFLLTSCAAGRPGQRGSGLTCSSASIPPDNRSATLTSLEEGRVHYISLHVGKVNGNMSIQSEPKVASFYVATQEKSSEELILQAEEIDDSPNVRLQIKYNASTEVPGVVEFHIYMCGKLLPLWDGDAAETLIERSRACEESTTTPTNATLDLLRLPWTEYVITVSICYGAFDSASRANTTLPVYKPKPGPLAGLEWDEDKALLSWKYRSNWEPSGFLVSLCKHRNDPSEACTNIETGHLDRQYKVNLDDLPRGELAVFVAPFVSFKGSRSLGPRSELVITRSEELAKIAQHYGVRRRVFVRNESEEDD